MQTRKGHLAWHQVLVAILPGLFVLSSELDVWQRLPFISFRSARMLSEPPALLALCIALCVIGYILERRIAVWSFPALGLLLNLLPAAVLGAASAAFLEPGPPSPLQTFLVNWVWPGILWVTIAAILVRHRHAFRMSLSSWALLGLLTASILVMSRPVGVWSLGHIWSLGAVLLLPVAVGLLFASSYDLLAGMIVVAGLFWWVNEIYDPSYGMLMWSSNHVAEAVVSVLPCVSLLIAAPVWTMLAGSTGARIWGLLMPPLLGLAGGEAIRSVVFLNTPVEYSLATWLQRSAGLLELIASIALAVAIYRPSGRSNVPIFEALPTAGERGKGDQAGAYRRELDNATS